MSGDRPASEGDSPPEGTASIPSAPDRPHPGGSEPDATGQTDASAAAPRPAAEKAGGNAPNSRPPGAKRKPTASAGFAPSDINDGRERYDWESRYPLTALNAIRTERWILFVLLYGIPLLMVLIWSGWIWGDLGLGPTRYSLLARFCYAWLGGMLGGTLFDLKWLYHSVAKGMWHQDRSLWRFFTPHISGALAFSFVALISSNLLRIFDQTTFTSSISVVSVSFLVGYFSDSAIAKLTEIAETLFGTTKKGREKLSEEVKAEFTPQTPAPRNQAGNAKSRR